MNNLSPDRLRKAREATNKFLATKPNLRIRAWEISNALLKEEFPNELEPRHYRGKSMKWYRRRNKQHNRYLQKHFQRRWELYREALKKLTMGEMKK